MSGLGTMKLVRIGKRYHFQDAPLREWWVTVDGLQIGKPFDPRSYDERQLPPADVNGEPLDKD